MIEKRTKRTRYKLKKVSNRKRLTVFRSNKHLYAQIIDDTIGKTLASASTNEKNIDIDDKDRKSLAEIIGKNIGCIICGGNNDNSRMPEIISRAKKWKTNNPNH